MKFYCFVIRHYPFIASTSCTNGQVELYSGFSNRHGNIRICVSGTWYKVCGFWNSVVDDNLASVVCSDLGYSPYGM